MGTNTHKPGKLAPVSLKTLRNGWHSDGGNLYLFVRGESRGWVFRFTAPDGTRRNMGLGSQHSISLAEARKQAAILREQVKHPITPHDPLAARQDTRATGVAPRLEAKPNALIDELSSISGRDLVKRLAEEETAASELFKSRLALAANDKAIGAAS